MGGIFLAVDQTGAMYGSVIWFDHLDTLTWSPLMFEGIVEEFRYEMQGGVKVHYCIPILSTVDMSGLRQLISQEDTQHMCSFVDFGHHFISMYLDHDESTRYYVIGN